MGFGGIRFKSSSLKYGLTSEIPVNPSVNDIYLDVETYDFYLCYVPGVWQRENRFKNFYNRTLTVGSEQVLWSHPNTPINLSSSWEESLYKLNVDIPLLTEPILKISYTDTNAPQTVAFESQLLNDYPPSDMADIYFNMSFQSQASETKSYNMFNLESDHFEDLIHFGYVYPGYKWLYLSLSVVGGTPETINVTDISINGISLSSDYAFTGVTKVIQ